MAAILLTRKCHCIMGSESFRDIILVSTPIFLESRSKFVKDVRNDDNWSHLILIKFKMAAVFTVIFNGIVGSKIFGDVTTGYIPMFSMLNDR